MNEFAMLAIALLAGVLLGLFFYGGLWWTIRKSFSSTQPAGWLFGSFFLRTFVTVGGFYVVLKGGWQCLAVCLVGFLIARTLVVQFSRAPSETDYERAGQRAP